MIMATMTNCASSHSGHRSGWLLMVSLPGKASGPNMFLVDEVLFCSHDREVVLHCSRIILGMEVDLRRKWKWLDLIIFELELLVYFHVWSLKSESLPVPPLTLDSYRSCSPSWHCIHHSELRTGQSYHGSQPIKNQSFFYTIVQVASLRFKSLNY